jgi:homocysteine S-methyltransferase
MHTNNKKSILKDWFLGDGDTTSSSSLPPRILLLDGGASTHLESKGATFAYRELWSSSLLLTAPDVVQAGHVDWLRDGNVNLISTVTYQCHYQKELWPKRQAEEVVVVDSTTTDALHNQNNTAADVIRDDTHMDTLWQKAVQLGRRAIEEQEQQHPANDSVPRRYHGLVASSGCFGAALANGAEYTGDYTPYSQTDIRAFHERKLHILRSLPIDAIAMETVPSLSECRVLRDILCVFSSSSSSVVSSLSPDHHGTHDTLPPCWISLACRNGDQLNDTNLVTEALEILHEIPIDILPAFGFNCGHAHDLPALLNHVIQFYRNSGVDGNQPKQSHRRRAIVFYPNAGETWDASNEAWKCGTACTDWIPTLLRCICQLDDAWKQDDCVTLPRIIVGGCCRTTTKDLAALRQAVDEYLADQEHKS